VLQTYLERVGRQPYMEAAQPIRYWMLVAFLHGLVVLVGVVITVTHLLTLKSKREAVAREGRAATLLAH
jgi:nitric oxide reductase subunit B